MEEKSFIRKYWKQIDLHSHTLRGIDCAGKSDVCNYKHKVFYENIKKFGTQLQAVTNHNTLYLEDHIKHAIICDLAGVGYIPGVEIDVQLKNSDKPFHCVFLLGPENDICRFSRDLNLSTKTKQLSKSVYYNEDNLSKLFSDMHFIYVVHAVKTKGLACSEDSIEEDKANINWVCKSIKNALAEPVLFENTRTKHVHSFMHRFKSFTDREDIIKFASHQVTTSDYHFDNNQEKYDAWINREKYAICAEPTFEGLELSIRHYESRFQLVDQILEPPTFIEKIHFINHNSKNLNVFGDIECSPYFNVIIGDSGSGKTLLLNEIFRSLNDNCGNLHAVITDDMKMKNNDDSVYAEYIGDNKLLETSFYKNIQPVAVEIDKIYKKMLDAHNPVEIAKLFNVSISNETKLVIQGYKTKVLEYENLLSNLDDYSGKGNESLLSIKSNISFINNNTIEEKTLTISRQIFDESILNKQLLIKNKIDSLLEQKKDFDIWIKEVSKIIPEESNDIENAIGQLKKVATKLELKRSESIAIIFEEKFNKRFVEIFNKSADSVNKIIGNKQVAVDKAKSVVASQTMFLKENIKNIIAAEFQCESFELSFPFDRVKSTTNRNQTNKYARITPSYSENDKTISSDGLENQNIINIKSNSGRIKQALNKNRISLLDDGEVKDFISSLRKNGVSFFSILNDKIPFTTELFDNQEWKNVQNINPGNLAKDYMNYYFNNVLETQRPNVVFIDQPENDVDKTFISTVLARFISDTKMSIQFFITSHEPILGVNADSNLIIESFRYDDGPIGYKARSFESKSYNNEETGRDVAARILDGGKDNVIKRNQIYGGSIDD